MKQWAINVIMLLVTVAIAMVAMPSVNREIKQKKIEASFKAEIETAQRERYRKIEADHYAGIVKNMESARIKEGTNGTDRVNDGGRLDGNNMR